MSRKFLQTASVSVGSDYLSVRRDAEADSVTRPDERLVRTDNHIMADVVRCSPGFKASMQYPYYYVIFVYFKHVMYTSVKRRRDCVMECLYERAPSYTNINNCPAYIQQTPMVTL